MNLTAGDLGEIRMACRHWHPKIRHVEFDDYYHEVILTLLERNVGKSYKDIKRAAVSVEVKYLREFKATVDNTAPFPFDENDENSDSEHTECFIVPTPGGKSTYLVTRSDSRSGLFDIDYFGEDV